MNEQTATTAGSGPLRPGQDVLVLQADEATVINEWVATTRVRISKRIVTEIQSIDVEVRREELIITHEPLDPADATTYPAGRAPLPSEDLTFILRSEIPSFSLTIMPTERVTIASGVVDANQTVAVELRSEHLELREPD